MALDGCIDDDHLVALDILSCRFLFELDKQNKMGTFGYGYWNGLGRELPYDDGTGRIGLLCFLVRYLRCGSNGYWIESFACKG